MKTGSAKRRGGGKNLWMERQDTQQKAMDKCSGTSRRPTRPEVIIIIISLEWSYWSQDRAIGIQNLIHCIMYKLLLYCTIFLTDLNSRS